jgi:hypothetical protein
MTTTNPFIDHLPTNFINHWTDSLGNSRQGKEPARRAYLRREMQATRDPIEHKHALESLQEFDREWK